MSLASIAVILIVFGTGARLTGPAARSLAHASGMSHDQVSSAGDEVLARRLVIGFRIELAGILVVLGLMVVLRYL